MRESHLLTILLILCLLLTVGQRLSSLLMMPVRAMPTTITVPDQYQAIQEAINNASSGDIIYVKADTYVENLVVNKTVSLIGEDKNTTIIDGNARGSVIRVTAPNVKIANFTVQNSGTDIYDSGIFFWRVTNITVQNTLIKRNNVGLLFRENTSNSLFLDNTITENGWGIRVTAGSNFNVFVGNTVINNPIGLEIASSHNKFYRNNFVNNTEQVKVLGLISNEWDNGVEGNYWSDYAGEDRNGDGIGDTSLEEWIDKRPLIEPWGQRRVYTVGTHYVVIDCNFTVASFECNQTLNQISFIITGPADWKGFFKVTIPKAVLSASLDEWQIFLGNHNVTGSAGILENETHTFVDFADNIAGYKAFLIAGLGPENLPRAYFSFTPDRPTLQDTISFTDESFDLDGKIERWFWDFGDGSNSTLQNPMYKYPTYNETYVVTLRVWDNLNLSDSTSRIILIQNLPPNITSFLILPTHVIRGALVNISVSCEDLEEVNVTKILVDVTAPNGTIYQYIFANTTFANVQFSITMLSGTYHVKVKAEDSKGLTTVATGSFEVRPPEKMETKVQLTGPSEVKAGLVILTCKLESEIGEPLAGKTIIFRLSGREWEKSEDTNASGIAIVAGYFLMIGIYEFTAVFEGDADFYGSNSTWSVVMKPLNTTLSMTPNINATQYERLVLSATLKDEYGKPVVGFTVDFYIRNGTQLEKIGYNKTSSNGVAVLEYIPLRAGTYQLEAVFEETGWYSGSHAMSTLNVIAKSSNFDYIPYVALTTLVFVIGILVMKVMQRKTHGSCARKRRIP